VNSGLKASEPRALGGKARELEAGVDEVRGRLLAS